jgi:hypothetical protein
MVVESRLQAIVMAHSAYGAISKPHGILFSFRGKLHETLDKAALQHFWVFRRAAWIVRNKAP